MGKITQTDVLADFYARNENQMKLSQLNKLVGIKIWAKGIEIYDINYLVIIEVIDARGVFFAAPLNGPL